MSYKKKTEKVSPKQQELLPGKAVFQQAENTISPVTIRELCEQRDRFNVNPIYQREDCWTKRQDQQCVDTVLLGLGIGLFEGSKDKGCWEVMDGHNRISAILRFYDNEYKTWTAAIKRQLQPVSECGPVEAGKFFKQLSPDAQDAFLSYHLPFSKVPSDMSAKDRASRFLCIQCQVPLTAAERLHVYPSEANAAATRIMQHSFWEDFYIGEANRKQVFLSSLYLLALQMTPSGMVDLRSGSYVPGLASGMYDDKVTASVIDAVQERLDAANCIYAGIQFTERAAVIAMYQSVMLLEKAGCTIQSSTHRGLLKGWIRSVIDESKHASTLPVYHQPIHRLLYASYQDSFWKMHRGEVMRRFGIQESDAA